MTDTPTIGIFYGSSAGHTENAARTMQSELQRELHKAPEGPVKLVNISSLSNLKAELALYKRIIIGVSTWSDGALQEDWSRLFPQLDEIDLKGTYVAVFGLGDQVNYPDAFQDAIGTVARKVRERGAKLVGFWPTSGYTFTQSQGVEDGHFMGLALDYDNQLHLSDQRIQDWTAQLLTEFDLR